MNRRSRIRHPVWFIWRREISVDSASFRECTLTMPGRERWVWGWGGGGAVCLPGAHSFHSLQKLWKCPLHTLGSSAELQRRVSGDKNALHDVAWLEVRCAMLSRGVGRTSLRRVNLYPTVTPDPDPVRKIWRRNRTQVWDETPENLTRRTTRNCNLCNKRNYLFGIRVASKN